MKSKEEIYAILVEQCEKVSYRYTRYEMVSYCIGRFEQVDETTWDCINQLHADGFIDS